MSALPPTESSADCLAPVAGSVASREFQWLAAPSIDFRALTPRGFRDAITAKETVGFWFVDMFGRW